MYETYYGFDAKPFQLNPDPNFYYGSRGHRRAMAYLEYGLHQNEGFIIITGEVGAGKTTIVRGLLQKLDAAKVVAAHLVSTQIDADDILRLVAAAFGIPAKGVAKADLLLALEAFLVSVTASGKRALLIVDEAQNLTPRAVEELRMLSNFQLEDHALLQSFLVGQPEFREIMNGEQMQQLRQRVIASYHLGPLEAEETRAYIEHRLACVGWRENPRIDPAAHAAIHAFSGGVPRRINTLCDRILLASFLAERSHIKAEDVAEVISEIEIESPANKAPSSAAGASLNGFQASPVSSGSSLNIDPKALLALLADGQTAKSMGDLAAGFQVSRMEERIARLETTLAAVLGLLQQAGAPKAAVVKPASAKLKGSS